jgi:hypothetical protein
LEKWKNCPFEIIENNGWVEGILGDGRAFKLL